MKKTLLTVVISLSLLSLFGQISEYGIPKSFEIKEKTKGNIKSNSGVLDIETAMKQAKNDSAFAIGIAKQVNIDLISNSTIIKTNEGKIYLYQININNAKAVGVDFNSFYIPENCKLFAYNKNRAIILGAYTYRNNRKTETFSIQPISGETIILEYYQPDTIKALPKLVINRIGMFYRGISEANNTKTVGDCFEDVHCESGIDVERSVLKWRFYDTNDESYYVCSCALINQDVISNDVEPYILTANHCGKNADLSTAIFYFNYQHPDCNTSGGTSMFTMTGASKKAKRSVYDMFLMELYTFPPPDYNVYLAGWDRESASGIGNVMGIHHPHGYRKSVSLGSRKNNTNTNFWRVEWDRNDAPTAGGSSGSPLFDDDNDKIIGWLSYGTSECDNLDGIDRYGKFRKAWTGPSSEKRLHEWLDPDDNDPNNINGRNPCFDNLLIQNRTFYSAQEYYQPENKVVVQAKHTIETQGNVTIEPNAEYVFKAGSSIHLKPGFHAKAGCSFVAKIEPCSGSKSLKIGNDIETDIYKIEFDKFKPNIKSDYIQAYPNPFENKTTIEYSLQEETQVTINIYNLQGVKILTIINNELHPSGIFQVDFFAKNLNQGIYICSLRTMKAIKTSKLIISKK